MRYVLVACGKLTCQGHVRHQLDGAFAQPGSRSSPLSHRADCVQNTSQPYVFANGDPTGYGYHGGSASHHAPCADIADFLNGWRVSKALQVLADSSRDVGVLQQAVSNCNSTSGVIEECPYFSYFDAQSQCRSTPEFNETVTGTLLPRLPGCNPISAGPAAATSCADPSPPSRIAGAPVTYQVRSCARDQADRQRARSRRRASVCRRTTRRPSRSTSRPAARRGTTRAATPRSRTAGCCPRR